MPITEVDLVLVAAAALVDRHGRVLLAQRPPGKKMAGLWEFPGGKIETGESPEDALIRELREELGIEIAAAALDPVTFASHGYESSHLLMPLFGCRHWRGEPASHEGQELAWVPPDALAAYAMPPADLPLLPAIKAYCKSP